MVRLPSQFNPLQSSWPHDSTTVYGFLDPAKGTGHLAAYIVGIAVGGIVLFLIMWAVTKLRDWVFRQGRGVKVVDLSELQSEKMRIAHV